MFEFKYHFDQKLRGCHLTHYAKGTSLFDKYLEVDSSHLVKDYKHKFPIEKCFIKSCVNFLRGPSNIVLAFSC